MAARTFSELFEIALVFVRLDHVARFMVNANDGTMRPASPAFSH